MFTCLAMIPMVSGAQLLTTRSLEVTSETLAQAPSEKDQDQMTTISKAVPGDTEAVSSAINDIFTSGAAINDADKSISDHLKEIKTTETEALAVANTAELLNLLGVVPQDLAKKRTAEKNEHLGQASVSEQDMLKILGQDPKVVYRLKDRQETFPDPMVIPWIRNAVIVREMMSDFKVLLAAGKITDATNMLKEIVTKYPETEEAAVAKEKLLKLQQLRDKADAQKLVGSDSGISVYSPSSAIELTLDPNIVIDAVMQDINHPDEGAVIINQKLYRVHDEIAGTYPKHTIKAVNEDSVVFKVSANNVSKEFVLSVVKLK